ncbi:MAG: S49 family peptidase, partial [Muribaculaceae bacterium]|nr:S49 family peptidase [Muribaculaceae bacterium]
MLKRFFIAMLGTVAGIFISSILAVGVIFAIVGVVAGKTLSKEEGVKKHSILHLNLDGALGERMTTPSLLDLVQGNDGPALALDEVCTALRLAANDKNIDGVFIDCGSFSAGAASCEEMLNALRSFKKSKKWIYAYSDGYSQAAYLLASCADSVFVNPMGSVDVHGTASATPFFKELLDKVGVKMQIIKVGTYKSAVEPFILNEMSEPARRQMQEYVDSIWYYLRDNIAHGRDVFPDVVQMWADSMSACWPASQAWAANMVDERMYRRLFDERLRELTGLDKDDDLRLVAPGDYVSEKADVIKAIENKGDHVALYYAVGDIVDSGKEGIVGQTVV